MNAPCLCTTFGNTHPLTQHHIPEHLNLQWHCCETLRAHNVQCISLPAVIYKNVLSSCSKG